ncbi:MAG: putative rane spanning protein, partial [Roseomonas sp.]|nr:putative rane spanning protein [Roseomonas sp.]
TAPTDTAETGRPGALMPAEELRARVAALRPRPWAPDRAAALAGFLAWHQANPGPLASVWLADGVEHQAEGDAAPALAAALSAAGPLTLARAESRPARLLLPPHAEPERLLLSLRQTPAPTDATATILARTGDGRALASAAIPLRAGATAGEAALELPLEIRNQVARLDIEGSEGAGSAVLLDERFRRRPVGLIGPAEAGTDTPLIGALYYLERALSPTAELRAGGIEQLLSRQLSVLILADRPVTDGREREALSRWLQEGGTLIRFAGPRLAENPDPLLPVRLRGGERQLGGALSWEQPQHLAAFPDTSPFAGLVPPPEVTVSAQVLADPDPRLSEKSWARLADGTPLVTAETRGAGRIVLFHVTANAEWSNLPLSGLFPDMLRRVVALSSGVAGAEGSAALAPIETMDGFGRLGPAPGGTAAIAANAFADTVPGPRHSPGWYGVPGEGGERRALNLSASLPAPRPMAAPPAGTRLVAIGGVPAERDLGPWLLGAALLLLAVDLLLSLGQRGLLARPARLAMLALLLAAPLAAHAQDGAQDGALPLVTRIGFVTTEDPAADETVRQGLAGLSDYVNRRTAAALGEPAAVRPGQDDLSILPLLYWAVLPDAQPPGPAAVTALNDNKRDGGIILFDTRDEGSGEGFAPGAREALRRLTQNLAVPPLMPVTSEHVLTRSFYLLQDLPGRFAGGQVWVSREQDRANDSVSPVIIGGNDWAGAWAVDGRGGNPYAAIPGGARQRTLAYRFGANLVMYALTGNYKGDQVHVPAILERLGN